MRLVESQPSCAEAFVGGGIVLARVIADDAVGVYEWAKRADGRLHALSPAAMNRIRTEWHNVRIGAVEDRGRMLANLSPRRTASSGRSRTCSSLRRRDRNRWPRFGKWQERPLESEIATRFFLLLVHLVGG